MRIAVAQINPTLGDLGSNVESALSLATTAKNAGADVVVFPAFALSGAWADNLLDSSAFARDCEIALTTFALSSPLPALLGAVVPAFAGGPGVLRPVFCDERVAEILDGGSVAHLSINETRVAFALDYQVPSLDELDQLGDDEVLIVSCAESYDGWAAEAEARSLRANVETLAKEAGIWSVYANLVGGADDAVFDGGSYIADSTGRRVAGGFLFDETVVFADVLEGESTGMVAETLTQDESDYSALKLALRDYVTKNNFSKVLIGLSGGIDSALVATLAVDALGADNVEGLLMPGPFSSDSSVRDAEHLAKNLGIPTQMISLQDPMESLENTLGPACGGKVTGLAHENLQARIRAIYLMTISNTTGSLVLNTGNKSEAAMGFSTLYGDTIGGFAPLADVYKTRVFQLARYRNGLGTAIPESTLSKAPSAELRPDQKDEDSMPHYDTLDAILTLHIEQGFGVSQIVERGHDEATVIDVLRRVSAAEYKRQQEPLGPMITKSETGAGHLWPITNRWIDVG